MKTIQIPNDLHKRLKMCSVTSGLPIVELVKQGIDYILKIYEEPNITIVTKDKIIKEYYNK